MQNIISVLKAGGDFDVDYVIHLYEGIKRNSNLPFRFFCITEEDIPHLDIETIKPIRDYPKWWNKVNIFKMFSSGVYIDLDTIITNDVDKLLEIPKDDCFISLDNFQPPGRLASGIMLWKGDYSFIFDDFNETFLKRFRGDQNYIEFELQRYKKPWFSLQEYLPDFLISYKHHYLFCGLQEESLLIFHGKPRPKDVPDIWYGNYDSRNERKLYFTPFGKNLSVDGRIS